MKKFNLIVLLLALTFFVKVSNTSALVMSPDDIAGISEVNIGTEDDPMIIQENIFVLGDHVFFNYVSIFDILEAFRSGAADANDVLYLKDGTGDWYNFSTGEEIPADEVEDLRFDVTQIKKEQVGNETEITGEGEVVIEDNKIIETLPPETRVELVSVTSANAIEIAELGENKTKHIFNQENSYTACYEDFDLGTCYLLNTEDFFGSDYFDGEEYYEVYTEVEDVLEEYTNGAGAGLWHAVVVDLGVDPSELVGTGYSIEAVDYNRAQVIRHAGEDVSETAFIMWLNAATEEREVTFTHTPTGQKINILFTSRSNVMRVDYETETEISYSVYDNDNYLHSGILSSYNAEEGYFVVSAVDYNEEPLVEFDFFEKDKNSSINMDTYTRKVLKLVDDEWVVEVPMEINLIKRATPELLKINEENEDYSIYNDFSKNYSLYYDSHGMTNGGLYISENQANETINGYIAVYIHLNGKIAEWNEEGEYYQPLADLRVSDSNMGDYGFIYTEEISEYEMIAYFQIGDDDKNINLTITNNNTYEAITMPVEIETREAFFFDENELNKNVLFETEEDNDIIIQTGSRLNGEEVEFYRFFGIRDGIEKFNFKVYDGDFNSDYREFVALKIEDEAGNWHWDSYQILDLKNINVAEPISFGVGTPASIIHAFNQNIVKLNPEEFVYGEDGKSVTIPVNFNGVLTNMPEVSYNGNVLPEGIPWFALELDFARNPEDIGFKNGEKDEAGNDIIRLVSSLPSIIEGTKFTLLLNEFPLEGVTYTFGSEVEYDSDNLYSITFVPVVEFDEIDFAAKKATEFTPSESEESWFGEYKYNLDSIGTVTSKLIEEEDYEFYAVEVSPIRELKEYNNGNEGHPTRGWYPIVVDFGVDPADLIGDGYTIEAVDYDPVQKARHGATGETEFVMWLSAGDSIPRRMTFTNTKTGETVKVDIMFNPVYEEPFTTEGEIEVAEYLSDVVWYDDELESFVIRYFPGEMQQITELDFFVDGKLWWGDLYPENGEDPATWHFGEMLELTNAFAADPADRLISDPYKEKIVWNQNSIANVAFEVVDYDYDAEEGYPRATINVEFDRDLIKFENPAADAKWYGLILDLDIPLTKLTSVTGGDDRYGIEPSDINATEVAKFGGVTENGEFIIWINEEATSTEDGKTILFYNEDDEMTEYEVTIKSSHIQNEDYEYLSLEGAKAITSGFNAEEEGELFEQIMFNQDSIKSVETEDQTVTVTLDREMDSYLNGSGLTQKWYAILIDLGLSTDKIGTVEGGYSIEANDIAPSQIARLGGVTEDGEFILWLRADMATRDITFTNLTEDNKYETYTVTINVEYDFTNLVGTTQTKLDNFYTEYYNQYHKKIINAPEDLVLTEKQISDGYEKINLDVEDDLYVEIGEYTSEEIPTTITINGRDFTNDLKMISIGNASNIYYQAFKVEEGKLYVQLLNLVAMSTYDTVFDIVFGEITYKVQTYNNHFNLDPLSWTARAITRGVDYAMSLPGYDGPDSYVASAVRIGQTDAINVTYSHGFLIVGFDFYANGSETPLPIGTKTLRLDQNNNLGITVADGDGTYSVYASYFTGLITTAASFSNEYVISVPGYGQKIITINHNQVPVV